MLGAGQDDGRRTSRAETRVFMNFAPRRGTLSAMFRPMSAKLRVAVVGCGNIAKDAHLPAILANSRLTVSAAVDTSEDRRAAFAALAGAPLATADLHAALNVADVALIATPPDTHKAVALAAAEHGVHVLCEKPLVPRAADAAGLDSAFASKQLVFGVNHPHRFNPGLRLFKQLLGEQAFGAPKQAWFRFGGVLRTAGASGFLADPARSGGGVLLDTGVHIFDLCRVLFPDVAFHGAVHDGASHPEMHAQVELRAGTVPVYVEVSFVSSIPKSVTVQTDSALLQFNYTEPNHVWLLRKGSREALSLESPAFAAAPVFSAVWQSVVDAIDNAPAGIGSLLPSASDGTHAVALAESARAHGRVMTSNPWEWRSLPSCELLS